MRVFLYLLGTVSLTIVSIGHLFKWLAWSGADGLMFSGTMFAIFAFVPYLVYDLHRAGKIITPIYLGWGALSIFGLAYLFKTLHLQFADSLLIISTTVFGFAFVPSILFVIFHYLKDHSNNQN